MAHSWLSLDPPTPATNTLDGIRINEMRAAALYFAAWQGVRLKLDASAERKWPDVWKVVGERKSQLSRWHSPQKAVNPAQAALNFCYAMLESQIRQALNAIGADVADGVLRADQDGRDSLVYDIMEALRGRVDDLLLSFLREHRFGAGDFGSMASGQVTIHPSLCRVLAQMVRVSQKACDDEARWFRAQLMDMSMRADRRQPKSKKD